MVRERTAAGLAAARAEGRVGGRRPKLTAQQRTDIAENVLSGRRTAAQMARLYRVSAPTISDSAAIAPSRWNWHRPCSPASLADRSPCAVAAHLIFEPSLPSLSWGASPCRRAAWDGAVLAQPGDPQLEERLGIRLLQRTTRSVALTEAGQRLLLRVRPALEELDAALADVGQLRDRPAGIVRVRCLRHAYHRHVGPILAGFHAAFPEVRLDITIDDAVVDLVAGGYDVGFTLGEVIEKDMVAVRIGGDLRQIAVASPAYIERHGRPETPKDLHAHRCVRWHGRAIPRP